MQNDLIPLPDKSLPIEVLIISFDGYSDVWDLSISSFFTHWPDCPWKVNLLTNSKTHPDPRVRSLCIGSDLDWSSNLIKALSFIETSYIITFFDDLILNEKVDSNTVVDFARTAIENNYDYLRLRPSPPPDGSEQSSFGSLRRGASYRVSLCTTIVKKETLLRLLVPGEHAWDFEKFGSLRSAEHDHFYATHKQIIPYFNAIEKGKWHPSILPLLGNVNIDPESRGIFQQQPHKPSSSKWKHFIVFTLMPVFVRRLFYQIQKLHR